MDILGSRYGTLRCIRETGDAVREMTECGRRLQDNNAKQVWSNPRAFYLTNHTAMKVTAIYMKKGANPFQEGGCKRVIGWVPSEYTEAAIRDCAQQATPAGYLFVDIEIELK